MHHVIPKSVDPFFVNDDDDGSLFPHHEYCRIRGCAVFFFGQGAEQCCSFHVSHRLRITLTVQMQRLKYAELVQKLEEMKLEIQKSSVGVDHQMSQDITSILGKSDKKVTPFTCMHGFIWQQQKNLLTRSSTGVRYHPMISRYCLSLAAKSPVYYDELCK